MHVVLMPMSLQHSARTVDLKFLPEVTKRKKIIYQHLPDRCGLLVRNGIDFWTLGKVIHSHADAPVSLFLQGQPSSWVLRPCIATVGRYDAAGVLFLRSTPRRPDTIPQRSSSCPPNKICNVGDSSNITLRSLIGSKVAQLCRKPSGEVNRRCSTPSSSGRVSY